MKEKFIIVLVLVSFTLFAQIPGPTGCRSFDKIDLDNDGFTLFEIDYYLNHVSSYALSEFGYDLSGYNFILYPSENDRTFNTNQITTLTYTNVVVFAQYCSLKLEYSGSGTQYNQADLDYNFSCHILKTHAATDDFDNDSVDNGNEDLNSNLNLIDDDTDNDGISNFRDNDDDGDLVLTVNEDYNGNSNVLDDDVNSNGIIDYLDNLASGNLDTNSQQFKDFIYFPNPITDYLFFESDTNFDIKIIDITGKTLINIKNNFNQINLSNLQSGIYFLSITKNGKLFTKKIVKK